MTVTCSPGAELQREQLNSIGPTHVKGTSMASSKRSCMLYANNDSPCEIL